MGDTTVHEWLAPRVERLVGEAVAAGFARDTVVAVLIDLAGSAALDTALPPAETALPHGPWPHRGADDEEGVAATPDLDGETPDFLPRPRP